jgi:pimeloyl-ACP methyl ester carboxylesterase
MPYFEHDGLSFFYLFEGPESTAAQDTLKRGEAQPSSQAMPSGPKVSIVLLIHGWTCDHLDWNFQMPLFTGCQRGLFIDTDGLGRRENIIRKS